MDTLPLYYEHPYLGELVATVVAIRDDGVVLDRTICYPEGGGQGGDRGTIGGCVLTDTTKAKDGTILHRVEDPTFVEGDEVAIILDWPRRYHFMRLHTAQHMASGILYQEFGIDTVSVHLGERIMMIECAAGTIDQAVVYRVEDLVNQRILENRPVHSEVHDRASAEALGLRRSIKVEGDSIRLVTVDGVDTIACGGLHVARTAEIARFFYMGQERIRGHIRLIFTVADVANEEIRRRSEAAEVLGTLFSAPIEEVAEVAAAAIATCQGERNELAHIKARLASLLLSQLAGSGEDAILWQVDETIALKDVAQAVAHHEELLLCAVKAEEERFSWLIAAKGSAGGRFDFAGMRSALFEGFDAKGGGRAPIFQGSGIGSGHEFLRRFKELAN
jgi:alanyl-tRNA synthetase